MENDIQFYLGIVVFIAAAVALFVMAFWADIRAAIDAYKGQAQTEEIEAIFDEIWSGTECSRAAAWYRTVEHLRAFDYPNEMVVEAEYRLLMMEYGHADKSKSNYTVSPYGKVHHQSGEDSEGLAPAGE